MSRPSPAQVLTLALVTLAARGASAQSHEMSGMHHAADVQAKDYDDPGTGEHGNASDCQPTDTVVGVTGNHLFTPQDVALTAGQYVCWRWDTTVPHTATADD